MQESRKLPFSYNSSINDTSAPSVTNNSSVISVPEGCVTIDVFQFIPWDNEDNLVPKQVDNIINLLFTGICLPLLFIVSFCTNIINMIVFYKHGLRERINACLFSLSLLDLLSISVVYANVSDVLYMFIIGRGDELGYAAQFFVRNFLLGLHGFLMASQMVYSVIALERCLCVVRPLLVKSYLSTKTTLVVIWVMVLIITSAVFVGGFNYGVLCVFDPRTSSTIYVNYPSDFYFRNKFIIDIIYGVVNGLFLPGLFFVSVTVCTVVTAVKLKKLTRWRQSVSSASDSVSSRDLALSRMIIGTSILFIVCIIPSVAVRASSMIIPELKLGGRYDNLAWVIRRFYQLGTAVNNTSNFFVYYAYGSKFRETTRHLFRFWCPDKSTHK